MKTCQLMTFDGQYLGGHNLGPIGYAFAGPRIDSSFPALSPALPRLSSSAFSSKYQAYPWLTDAMRQRLGHGHLLIVSQQFT